MGRINTGRVVLAAAVAAIVFIVLEVVVEGLTRVLFGIDESALFVERFGPIATGARFQAVNLLVLFGVCLLMMWLYAALRAHFGDRPRTVMLSALFLWLFVLLLWANFVNLGVFPLEIALLSLLFNLVELPGAAIGGAAVYRSKPA